MEEKRGKFETSKPNFDFSKVIRCFSSTQFFTSTQRSRKMDKILAKFFQSFISSQIIAAAPISFLFLKALYLSFQMHTSCVASWRHLLAFQISVELIPDQLRSFFEKNFYMRFQWWQTVTRVGQ